MTASGAFTLDSTVNYTITYTVTLTNTGGATQPDNPGYEFVDILPANVTLVSTSASSGSVGVAPVSAIDSPGTTDGTNTVTWNGSILPGDSTTIGIKVTAKPPPTCRQGLIAHSVSNQGSIFFDADNNGTNETSRVTDDPSTPTLNDPTNLPVPPLPCASVTGTKTVSGTSMAGGTLIYTIVLNNTGTGAQGDNPGNELTDVLPPTLALVSANSTSGTAVATLGTNTVTWNGAIPAGGSVTITITANINASACGMVVSNQGTISYDADNNGSNEATGVTDNPGTGTPNDPASFTLASTALVTAIKTVAGAAVPGQNITYAVVLNNSGCGAQNDNPSDEFTDVLPSGLTLASATASSGTAVANVGNNTVTWNGSVPANGGTVTITITATVNAGTAGQTISNQGTCSYDSDANNTNDASCSTDNPNTPAAPDPTDVTVTEAFLDAGAAVPVQAIGDGDAFIENNETWKLTIPLTSVSGVKATAITATLTSSTPGITIVSGNSAYPDLEPSTSGNNVTPYSFRVGAAIPCGSIIDFTLTVNYTGGPSPQSFNFSIKTGSPGALPVCDATLPDVTSTMTVSGTLKPGGTVIYTVILTNSGSIAQLDNPGDEFVDILPASVALVSATASFGTAVANVDTNTVTWNGSIPAATSRLASNSRITYVGTVRLPGTCSAPPGLISRDGIGCSCESIFNQATISVDLDANGTNETILFTDDDNANVYAFTATKTVSGDFTPGGVITYTVVLTNSGCRTQNDNAGDEFTDALPAGLTLVSATATSGIAATVGNEMTWNGDILAGDTVTITITATVLPAAAGQTIFNQGTCSYDSDGNGTNDATSLTDDPATPVAGDPTSVTVPQPIFETPTLSQTGLALLGLTLAGAALLLLRRLQPA